MIGIVRNPHLDEYWLNWQIFAAEARQAACTIAALVILREKVLRPILAGVGKPKMGRKPMNWSSIDEHCEAVRQDVFTLMEDLRIAA